MTRIDKKFAQLKAESKKAFVSYIMAGDPNLELSYESVSYTHLTLPTILLV